MLQRLIQMADESAKWRAEEAAREAEEEAARSARAAGGGPAQRPLMIRTGKAKTEGGWEVLVVGGGGLVIHTGKAKTEGERITPPQTLSKPLPPLRPVTSPSLPPTPTHPHTLPPPKHPHRRPARGAQGNGQGALPTQPPLPHPHPPTHPPKHPHRRPARGAQGNGQGALPWGAPLAVPGAHRQRGSDCGLPVGVHLLGVPAGGGPAVLRGEGG